MMRQATRRVGSAAVPAALVALISGAAVAAPTECDILGSFDGMPAYSCGIATANGLASARILAQWDDVGPFGIVDFNISDSRFIPQGLDALFQSTIQVSVNGGDYRDLRTGVTSATVDGANATVTYLLDDVLDSQGNPGLEINVRYRIAASRTRARLFTVVQPRNLTEEAIDFSLISYTDLDLFCPIGCDPDLDPAQFREATFDEQIRVRNRINDPAVEELQIRQEDTDESGDQVITDTRYFKQESGNLLPVNFAAAPYTLPFGVDNRFLLLQEDQFVVDGQTEFDPEAYSPYDPFSGACIPVGEPNSNAPAIDPFCDGPDFASAAEYITTLNPGQLRTLRWVIDHTYIPGPTVTATDVTLAQIPAPTALAMLSVGLIGIGAALRRRAR